MTPVGVHIFGQSVKCCFKHYRLNTALMHFNLSHNPSFAASPILLLGKWEILNRACALAQPGQIRYGDQKLLPAIFSK